MNINQLAKSLCDACGGSRSDHRAVALELILQDFVREH